MLDNTDTETTSAFRFEFTDFLIVSASHDASGHAISRQKFSSCIGNRGNSEEGDSGTGDHGNMETEEQGNKGTGDRGNRGTGEQGNRGTGKQGNKGTEEQGNKRTEEQGNKGTGHACGEDERTDLRSSD